ncbi:MAG TPA: acyltransferase family protein [Planctomycetaceae bacterium]
MRSDHIGYRPDIDGLRAIAVLSVVFCHAGLAFPGGYVGVDVFFVISGYLITSLILKDLARGSFSAADFWERRVRRIAPALLAVTAATLAAGWFLLLPSDYRELGKSVVGLAVMLSNVQFWRETGYFEREAESQPLLHTWSLAVEEQFYLLMPGALFFVVRAGALNQIVPLLGLAAAVSFGLSVYGTAYAPDATFYLLPARAWELLAGSILAAVPALFRRSSVRREAAGVAGLALIVTPCFLYDTEVPFPGIAALPPVAGAVLLIASGDPQSGGCLAARLLAWRPLVFVGMISYSLYLWHWPLLVFARYQTVGPLPLVARCGLVAAGFVAAVLSWRFIERPFRNRSLLAPRRRVATIAATAFASLLLAGYTVYDRDGFDDRLSSATRRIAATGTRDRRFHRDIDPGEVPDDLIRLGDAPGGPDLLVWGDSHAMALLPGIDDLCREHGLSGRAATHSSTAPVVGYFVRTKYGLNEEAVPFGEAVLKYVHERKIRAVVLAANWSTYFRDDGFAGPLFATVDRLRETGATVYFVKDVPSYHDDIASAAALHSWRGLELTELALPLAEYEARNEFHGAILPRLQERGVVVLDPIAVFKARSGSDLLMPADAHGLLYYDKGHLSTYGSHAMKPIFAPLIRSLAEPAAGRAGLDRSR